MIIIYLNLVGFHDVRLVDRQNANFVFTIC